jgi:hemerythrin-like metal-binding protein
MPIIQWSPRMSVDHPIIDGQHRELIKYINELHDAMMEGQGQEQLGETITFIGRYATTHFRYEEEYQRSIGYPEELFHRGVHESFIGKVIEMRQRPVTGGSALTIEVSRFLGEWLRDHIMKEDQEYAAFARRQRAA